LKGNPKQKEKYFGFVNNVSNSGINEQLNNERTGLLLVNTKNNSFHANILNNASTYNSFEELNNFYSVKSNGNKNYNNNNKSCDSNCYELSSNVILKYETSVNKVEEQQGLLVKSFIDNLKTNKKSAEQSLSENKSSHTQQRSQQSGMSMISENMSNSNEPNNILQSLNDTYIENMKMIENYESKKSSGNNN
jgi:hypothetical protein